MILKNPILDIETTDEDSDKFRSLKEGFEELTPQEKFDVVELQNIMLQKVSRHHEMYGIPKAEKKAERNEDEIISQMSSRSLDYSQMCINYYVSKISSSLKK
ncbi:hypothetical protein [Methanolobus sp. WCC4]|uniref:hypothetical protein n=1 Tax=Methanolobus sp. WCC4 TaxID=3125784 RepID=UPI0030F86083